MKPFAVISLLLLSAAAIMAQKGSTGGGGFGSGSGSTPTNPTNPSPRNPSTNPNINNPFPNSTNRIPGSQTPIFLSGKVVMEDGTPPPDLVRIDRSCGATERGQAYADSKGRFQFQFNGASDVLPDASDPTYRPQGSIGSTSSSRSGNYGGYGGDSRNLMNCEIKAYLPGYRSSSINLAMHSAFDNPNIGTIVLHRMGNVEGTTVSVTSLQAPKDAQKAFERGRDAARKGKTDDAGKQFEKAVDLYPNYATAWYELGRVQLQQNRSADAAKSFEKSKKADPKLITPYVELSTLSARANDWQKTLELTDQAIKLNPADFPSLYFYNAVANLNLRHLENAEKSAREAQKLDTRHQLAKSEMLLATVLAEKKDYSGALEHMRGYLQANPNAGDADTVKTQIAELEKLAPKRD